MFKKILHLLNPFNMNEIVSTILKESSSIQNQLIDLQVSFNTMAKLIEDYEEKLEKAEKKITEINKETLHILETIKIHLEMSCDTCKGTHINTVLDYCNEIIKEVEKDG